jgi:hypothetical protein
MSRGPTASGPPRLLGRANRRRVHAAETLAMNETQKHHAQKHHAQKHHAQKHHAQKHHAQKHHAQKHHAQKHHAPGRGPRSA